MTPHRSLLTLGLVLALALAACGPKAGGSGADVDPRLEVFTDPALVEDALAGFLQKEFGLAEASVVFMDDVVTIVLEQPEGISDEQVTLLYLGALDAAARFAPGSERVRLTIAVSGDPFLSIECDTEHINDYRRGEIDLAAFIGGLTIHASATAASPAASGPVTEAAPTEELAAILSVGPVSIVADGYGGWNVYAVIINEGDTHAYGVSAQVDVYDEAGGQLESVRTETMQSSIPPQSLGALLVHLPEGATPVRAEASQPEADMALPAPVIELSLGGTRQAADPERQQATIVTEMRNEGDQAIVIESAVGLLMTEGGEILAHQFDWNFAPQLLAGESTPIAVSWYNLSPELLSQVGRIEILPEARLASGVRETGFAISQTSTRVYLDAEGRPHLVSVVRNDGQDAERPVLLGSLYDAEGAVLDALSLWAQPPLVLPGMVTAFDISTWPLLDLAPELASQASTFDLRIDAFNSYAPQAYEIVKIEVFDLEWRAEDGAVVVEGTAQVNAGNYDDVIGIMAMRDSATGALIAAGSGYFYGSGGEASFYERLMPDPAYDLAGAELSVDVYGVNLLD